MGLRPDLSLMVMTFALSRWAHARLHSPGARESSVGFAIERAHGGGGRYTPAFAKRQRLLSPEQYEIAGVLTSRGVSRVMLFPKAIIQAEVGGQ